MEAEGYVMEGLYEDKLCLPEQWYEREGPAQAASRDWEEVFGAREDDQAHQNGGRAIRSGKEDSFWQSDGGLYFA